MKGEIINYHHKDIYFLDTKTNAESTDLANLFASPAGREMVKFKPRVKSKHKLNPALEFFIQNKATKTAVTTTTSTITHCRSSNSSSDEDQHMGKTSPSTSSCGSSCSFGSCGGGGEGGGGRRTDATRSRRSSIDLYEEAATILGLTCSQTDNCKCIECQCHYFDFEEEIDFPTGSECVMGHASTCTIQ